MYILQAFDTNVIGIQVLAPIDFESTESIILYDYKEITSDEVRDRGLPLPRGCSSFQPQSSSEAHCLSFKEDVDVKEAIRIEIYSAFIRICSQAT